MPTPVPFEQQYLRFLAVEEDQQKRLVSFYSQARAELTEFIENPPVPLTASEQAFFGALTQEVDRLATDATISGTNWTQIIPRSFAEGALQHSPAIAFNAVHDNAARALSGYSLNLITAMGDDMRRVVQQQIGVGLLEGATREVVSQRILDTGLTNIPHWRSVEDRAAAIARTEMMRAYNAGNLAGIRDTGAPAVRWITGADERVCPICGPRHGKIYKFDVIGPTVQDWEAQALPYPRLEVIPPAHVKCRCSIRAFYPVKTTPPPLPPTPEPTPPEGGLIDTTPTPVPAAPPPDPRGFGQMHTRLHDRNADDAGYWQDVELDDIQLRSVTDALNDRDTLAYFMDSRFGVKFDPANKKMTLEQWGIWESNAELRFHVLKGIEQYRPLFSRNIAFSERWNTLTFNNITNQTGSVLAQCWQTGQIDLDLRKFLKYLNKPLRAGEGTNGIEEIVIHELGHALHNRFGIIEKFRGNMANYGPKAAELGGDYPWNNNALIELWKEWAAIRRKTKAGIWGETGGGALVRQTEFYAQRAAVRANAARHLADEWDRLPLSPADGLTIGRIRVPGGQRYYKYAEPDGEIGVISAGSQDFAERLATMIGTDAKRLEADLKKLQSKIAGGEHYPTEYAKRGGVAEDFAESVMLYVLNPKMLQEASPLRFAFMRDVIFAEGKKGARRGLTPTERAAKNIEELLKGN
jgi:SPP1 gp7 family putative phage head morphogenesis protein